MKLYRLYGYNPLLGEREPITPPASLSACNAAKKNARGGIYTDFKIVIYEGEQLNFLET